MRAADATERLGVFAVGLRSEQAGWAFRELLRPDRGVDAHIEGRTDGRLDGRLLALQIKSGESHFRHRIPGGWRFYIDPEHIAYWRDYAMPVLLILYNPSAETAYWQVVNPETRRSTGKNFAVDLPEANVFDARCAASLDKVAADAKETPDGLRDRRAEADLPWIWLLDGGGRLILEVEQDLVQGDGRCVLRMIATDHDSETPEERIWPWVFLAGRRFKDELGQLFPWADKQVDEPWYREHTIGDFLSEEGRWEPDEWSYATVTTFDDWFNARFASTIAPYATTADGRTALWRLQLTLNAEGHDLLARDQQEMIDDALEAISEEDPRHGGRQGTYAVEFIEDYGGGLENVVFIFGDELEDKESLLLERHIFDQTGGLTPGAVEAILRHAGIGAPTYGWATAFNQRFAEELGADGREPKITTDDLEGWLQELSDLAKHRCS